MKTYFTNSLATELSEKMSVGAKVVLYTEHLEALAEKEIYIQQLRGALGYSVPGSISENPEILNGIADALHRQIAEKDALISGHEEATESLLAEIHRQDAEIERLRKALTEIRGYTKSGITYNIADEAVKEDA